MGYSQQTPNYGLPQYEANDRPSYLGDWNEAMGNIDQGMQTNKNNISNNATAVSNMGTYVDNQIADMNTTLNEKMTEVDNSIAIVNDSLNAMGIRVDDVENKIKFLAHKNVLAIGDSYMCTEESVRIGIGDQLASIASNWTFHNYADSGSAFTFGGVLGRTFEQQLSYAASQLSVNDIDYIIIVGGRNEAGPQDSSYTPPANLPSACASCFAYAKNAFPNAQIFVFPTPYDWKAPNRNIISVYNTMCQESNKLNCFVVKGCYTWGSGEESTLYVGGTDIHPSSSGALYMAHIIYNKVTNKDNNAWRNRNDLVASTLFIMQEGIVNITGSMTAENEIPFASLPNWIQTSLLPIGTNPENEYRKHLIGIQEDDDSLHSISISSNIGMFVHNWNSVIVIYASSSTFPYMLGT